MNADTGTDERSRTDEAKEEGREVADHAKQEASSVADTARQEVDHVAEAAKKQARNFVGDIQDQLRDQSEQQVGRVAEALHGFSDQLQALQEGRTEDAGPLADYLEDARSRVDDAAKRIDELGVGGLLDETRRFARRRPGRFLGAAAVAGLMVGRIARAGRDAQSSNGSGGESQRGGQSQGGTGVDRAQIPPRTSAPTPTTAADINPAGGTARTVPPAPAVVEVDEVETVTTESAR